MSTGDSAEGLKCGKLNMAMRAIKEGVDERQSWAPPKKSVFFFSPSPVDDAIKSWCISLLPGGDLLLLLPFQSVSKCEGDCLTFLFFFFFRCLQVCD